MYKTNLRTVLMVLALTLCCASLTGTARAASYKVLKDLDTLVGRAPIGALTFDSAGDLYGTTANGGGPLGSGFGTVFQLTPTGNGSWSIRALYVFPRTGDDGKFPRWNPFVDDQGNVYGVTLGGGSSNDGVLFQLTPDGSGLWNEKVLYNYSLDSSGHGANALLRDAAGNYFGTAAEGGVHGIFDRGTAYELSPAVGGGYNLQILHYFTTAKSDGNGPGSNLVQDAAGNFYGTTRHGGAYDMGTVFKISRALHGGWNEEVIYSFNGRDGWLPLGAIAIDSAGNLYGTTEYGGGSSNNVGPGTLFQLSPAGNNTWRLTNIHLFGRSENDGSDPTSGVSVDATGNVYGTTYSGGAHNEGTVFEFSPDGNGGWIGKILHAFNGDDGAGPSCQLIFDQSGNLYGTTRYGGANGNGVVFEITP